MPHPKTKTKPVAGRHAVSQAATAQPGQGSDTEDTPTWTAEMETPPADAPGVPVDLSARRPYAPTEFKRSKHRGS